MNLQETHPSTKKLFNPFIILENIEPNEDAIIVKFLIWLGTYYQNIFGDIPRTLYTPQSKDGQWDDDIDILHSICEDMDVDVVHTTVGDLYNFYGMPPLVFVLVHPEKTKLYWLDAVYGVLRKYKTPIYIYVAK